MLVRELGEIDNDTHRIRWRVSPKISLRDPLVSQEDYQEEEEALDQEAEEDDSVE